MNNLTNEQQNLYNSLTEQKRNDIRTTVITLGYYQSIGFFTSKEGGNHTEEQAKILADIGLQLERSFN